MHALNLPPYKARICEKEGKPYIFDDIRKCYVALTPEEWVRRHVVEYMLSQCNIQPQQIVEEYPVEINTMAQRADIVLPSGQDFVREADFVSPCSQTLLN